MVNCTLASNEVTGYGRGGGLYSDAGSGDPPIIRNTILGDNSSYRGPDAFGRVASRDYNLIEDPTDCILEGLTEHSVIGEDPALEPLADNGGGTKTHALAGGSPALDAGSCTDHQNHRVRVDQRGVDRPQGSECDMGAHEVEQPTPTLTLTADTTEQGKGCPIVLTATVLDEAGQPLSGVQVTFTADPPGVFSGGHSSTTVPTRLSGEATVTLNSSSVGDTTVTAQAGYLEDSLTLFFFDSLAITGVQSDSPVELGDAAHFTATVQGVGPYAYTWDFGGEGTASGEDTATPSYTYSADGTYTVTIGVENACEVAEAALVVDVCDPVTLVGVTTDAPVRPGESVHFTATVVGTGPYTYTWDFGGEGAASGEETATPDYTYAAEGTYTVTVEVENPCGSAQGEVVVEVCDPVTVVGLISDSPVELGEAVHFTATVEGTGPYTYTWGFGGDGTVSGEGTATPSYTYAAGGAYTVTLEVENGCGAARAEVLVEVCDPVTVVDVTSDSPVELGEAVHFTATVDGTGPYTYTWDFGGDGEAGGEDTATPSHTYGADGRYTVTVEVENGCGVAQAEVVVEVCDPVTVVGLISDSPVELGEAVHFTATVEGTGPYTYTWDFGGDGTVSGEETATPNYMYSAGGAYTVTLEVENACGVAKAGLAVRVICDPVRIVGLDSNGPVTLGESMHFTATVSGSGPIRVAWDFESDGTVDAAGDSSLFASHAYGAPGTYTATATASNCWHQGPFTNTKSVTVVVEPLRFYLPFVAKRPLGPEPGEVGRSRKAGENRSDPRSDDWLSSTRSADWGIRQGSEPLVPARRLDVTGTWGLAALAGRSSAAYDTATFAIETGKGLGDVIR